MRDLPAWQLEELIQMWEKWLRWWKMVRMCSCVFCACKHHIQTYYPWLILAIKRSYFRILTMQQSHWRAVWLLPVDEYHVIIVHCDWWHRWGRELGLYGSILVVDLTNQEPKQSTFLFSITPINHLTTVVSCYGTSLCIICQPATVALCGFHFRCFVSIQVGIFLNQFACARHLSDFQEEYSSLAPISS
jgi:hypothetical protein